MKKTKRKRTTREKQAQSQKRRKNILIAFMCVVLICVGYIGADAFMLRHDRPVTGGKTVTLSSGESGEQSSNTNYISLGIPSVALDNSVMLKSVLNSAKGGGYNSVAFDLKRDDGTIGYTSALTTVDTFGGISTPATHLHESLKAATSQNITPVARICCLKDNVVPKKSSEMALMKDNKVYEDKNGNTYLNPDSEAAMKYLREIVSESYNLGVRVFVLSAVTLPDGAPNIKSGGFDSIVSKIRGDAVDAEFIEAVDVTLNGWDAEEGEYNDTGLKNEIKKLPKLKSNQIYVVKTEKDINEINKKLKSNKLKGYIIYED